MNVHTDNGNQIDWNVDQKNDVDRMKIKIRSVSSSIYTLKLTDDSAIFNDHTIIKNVQVLNESLISYFENLNDNSVEHGLPSVERSLPSVEINEQDGECFEFRINVTSEYMHDYITIRIPFRHKKIVENGDIKEYKRLK